MSFPTSFAPPDPDAIGGSQRLPPSSGGIQDLDPVPGDAVEMLRQTRPWVGFIGFVMIIFAMLVILGAAAGAFYKRESDPMLARNFGLVAMVGAIYLFPASYLRLYSRRIKQLVEFPTGDLLASALAAQKGFWRIIALLMVIMLLIYAGVLGLAIASKGLGGVVRLPWAG